MTYLTLIDMSNTNCPNLVTFSIGLVYVICVGYLVWYILWFSLLEQCQF